MAMLNNLSSLTSLDSVLHLTACLLLRSRSSSLTFTHILHSLYPSKCDLDAYFSHPDHIAVVTNYVKPIIDDIMAVDWVASGANAVKIPPGAAMRVTFFKLKGGSREDEKNEVLGMIGGIKEKFPGIEQLSFWENFSPARAKVFSIAFIAVFKGANELEGLDAESEATNKQKDLVRDKLDGVVVLDFMVPSSKSRRRLASDEGAFTVSRKVKPEEVVRATLSSLPDEVVDTVGTEDSVSERRRKLEFLEMEEKLIKEEEEKNEEELARKKESVGSQEDMALKEMNIPTAREAQEQARARALDKRDQLCEISRALAVLASASVIKTHKIVLSDIQYFHEKIGSS